MKLTARRCVFHWTCTAPGLRLKYGKFFPATEGKMEKLQAAADYLQFLQDTYPQWDDVRRSEALSAYLDAWVG